MKKYYLFLIILFALKCSIIAQKVEPSRTYNLIEECYCTSFKQVGKMYNGGIVYACTKCGKEALANPNGEGGTIEDIIELNKREAKLVQMLKNPSASGNEETLNNMLGDYQSSAIDELSNEHYCVSFKFIDENPTGFKNYECSECGHKVTATEERTISDIIADNKERMRIGNTALNLLKNSQQKTQPLQKNQKLSNQQKPTTTSKPQGKTTSKPSTTKKQQTNLDIPSVNRSSSKVAVEQPKPTVEENLCKVSDGLDAFIDMVKKISNKDGTNNTTLKENYNPIQERALKEALRYNNPLNPVCDPNKVYIATLDDLQEFASIMKEKYSDEAESHFGRDVASLKPYSLDEVIYELENGLSSSIAIETADQHHQDDEKNTFSKDPAIMEEIIFGGVAGAELGAASGAVVCGLPCAVFGGVAGGVAGAVAVADKVTLINNPNEALEYLAKMKDKGIENVKITMSDGREGVYNLGTGKIVMNVKLGTQNKGERGTISTLFGEHKELDVDTHETKAIPGNSFTRDGDQYKYVGILYERDKIYPDKYYIINGQTGERMTAKQAYEFPTTISDMWVNENHKQSVIDPLDPEYKEHLEYHEELNKNRKYTEEEIQQGLYIFRGDMMSSVPQRNNSSNPNTPKRATQNSVFGK